MDMRTARAYVLRLILREWCHATMNIGSSDWSLAKLSGDRGRGGGDGTKQNDP